MRTLDEWLEEYGDSHQNPVNKAIHRVAVPVIALDMLGLARAVPTEWLLGPTAPSAATLGAIAAVAYYFRLSPPLAAGMGFLAAIGLALLGAAFFPALIAVFVIAWAAQFVGHALESKKPSFARDLQFLSIGPLWLLDAAYRRMGLRPATVAQGNRS